MAMTRTRSYETGGWSSSHRRQSDGAIESTQRMVAPRPVVERTADGALMLGAAYWCEVERLTRRLVRMRSRNGSLELRVARRGPALLRFGNPRLAVTPDVVSTTYPIVGGLLARRAAGSITLSMRGDDDGVELRSAI